MVGPAAKRAAVAHLQAVMSLSERRACSIVDADRKMIYRSTRLHDAALRGRLRDLANERRRFGYRRLFVLLRREGEPSGINRIYRLYREEGLTVRKRRARRKAVGTRAPILVEAKPNARWSLDFVHDQFANAPEAGLVPRSNRPELRFLPDGVRRGIDLPIARHPGASNCCRFVDAFRQISKSARAGRASVGFRRVRHLVDDLVGGIDDSDPLKPPEHSDR
jgi:HTH-like domain